MPGKTSGADLDIRITMGGEREVTKATAEVRKLAEAIASVMNNAAGMGATFDQVSDLAKKRYNATKKVRTRTARGVRHQNMSADEILSAAIDDYTNSGKADPKVMESLAKMEKAVSDKIAASLRAQGNSNWSRVMTEANRNNKELLEWRKNGGGDPFYHYEKSARGGWAASIQRMNSRLLNSRGLIGLGARIGQRAAQDPDTWIGGAFGRRVVGKTGGGNVNNWFGGLMRMGTGNAMHGVNLGAIGGAALAGVPVVLGLAAKKLVEVGEAAKAATGQLEMIKTQMSVVMGSESVAQGIYSGVESFALRSPFGVATSADMATLLKQSGVSASELLDTLRMIGDTSSGNAEKMRRVANNYAQIMAIGKASMLDMRQFAYAGIPIYKEVADYMKVSQLELRSMISEGKVSAEVIEAVFKRMTGSGGTFENATARGARTIQARMQNLEDLRMIATGNFGRFYMGLGGKNTGDGLGGLVQSLKEGFWNGVNNIFGGMADKKEFNSALGYLQEIKAATESIDKKVKDRGDAPGIPGAATAGELEYYKLLSGDYEKNKGIIYRSISSAVSPAGKKVVDDKTYAEIKAYYDEVLKDYKTLSTIDASAKVRDPGDRSDSTLRSLKQIDYLKGKYGENYEPALRDAYERMERLMDGFMSAGEAERLYQSKKGEYSGGQVWTVFSEADTEAIAHAVFDAADKKANMTDSLFAQSQKYAAEYRQSEESRQAQQQEAEEGHKNYSKRYDDNSKYIDKNNELLLKNVRSMDELVKVLRTGLFAPSAQFTVSGMTDRLDQSEERKKKNKEDRANFASNAREAARLMLAGKNPLEMKEIQSSEAYQDLLSMQVLATKGDTESMNRLTNVLEDWLHGFENGSFARLFSEKQAQSLKEALLLRLEAPDKAKFAQNNGEPLDEPLWKRLINQTMGINFEMMRGKRPDEVVGLFSRYAQKQRVGDMMSAMLSNGSSYSDVIRMMRYGNKTNLANGSGKNAYKPFQLDWGLTDQQMTRFALGTKSDVKVTQALKESAQKRLENYNEMFVQMSMGAENLQKYIAADSTGRVASDFENAFSLLNMDGVNVDRETGELYRLDENGNRIVVAIEELGTQVADAIQKAADEQKRIIKEAQSVESAKKLFEILENGSLSESDDIRMSLFGRDRYGLTSRQAALASRWTDTKEWFNPSYEKEREFNERDFIAHAADKNAARERLSSFYNHNYEDWSGDRQFRKGDDLYSVMKKTTSLVDDTTAVDYVYFKNGEEIQKDAYDDAVGSIRNLMKVPSLQKIVDQAGGTRYGDQINAIMSDTLGEYFGKFGISEDTPDALLDKAYTGVIKLTDQIMTLREQFEALGESARGALSALAGGFVNNTMEKFGENIAKGVDGFEDMDKVIKNLGKSMMSNLAAAATQAGLSLIASGNYAAGFALIAAGGLGSFLSGLMTDTEDDDSDDVTQKLKDLKADLADLLKQAREDAIYYENQLRHKNALSYNSAASGKVTSVNDAVITPQGNVITTHPEDYLIASKNPGVLFGAGGGSPVVNIDIQNNTGKRVEMRQEARQNGSGGVDIIAVIEEVVGDYVSSSRSDDAFAARDARFRGRAVSA